MSDRAITNAVAPSSRSRDREGAWDRPWRRTWADETGRGARLLAGSADLRVGASGRSTRKSTRPAGGPRHLPAPCVFDGARPNACRVDGRIRLVRSLTVAAPFLLAATLSAQSHLFLDGPAEWPQADQPVPLGSLVKPFTAVAWADVHGPVFPETTCDGRTCWLPAGHGRVGLEEALAHSCNAYFRRLARELTPEEVTRAALRFGLPGPPADAATDDLFGLGGAWRAPPAQAARAYSELARRRADPLLARIVDGLGRAARQGTASEVDLPGALAKTGTAPCIHTPRLPGDGYAILLYPADSPRYTVVVQFHGRTGREAARVAGELLRSRLQP